MLVFLAFSIASHAREQVARANRRRSCVALVVAPDFVSGANVQTMPVATRLYLHRDPSLRWVLTGGMETFLDAEPAVRDHLFTMH